ncbi:hypothetical protein MKQ70_14750 [Chitinophaga sedimenti]|uniref:hypothetical protein n=1 Tax=Chitinophaga sedimenti TaxID=2033606 RepID=UPI002005543D|nr:hypothetical protein [Chitinophaga sedimenti]MCK7556205.1 hypothetical protein [Chitinophaga sedimenti]
MLNIIEDEWCPELLNAVFCMYIKASSAHVMKIIKPMIKMKMGLLTALVLMAGIAVAQIRYQAGRWDRSSGPPM